MCSRMDDDNDHVPLGMKTKVDVINEVENCVLFNGYSPYGFILNNKARVPGPIVAFPKVLFQWNVSMLMYFNNLQMRKILILSAKIRSCVFFTMFKYVQTSRRLVKVLMVHLLFCSHENK